MDLDQKAHEFALAYVNALLEKDSREYSKLEKGRHYYEAYSEVRDGFIAKEKESQ